MKSALALLLAGIAPATLATAQSAPADPIPSPASGAEDPDAEYAEEIVVTAGRTALPGAVIGDIPPEVQLSPADIRSYGVSTINELLAELAPQTGSGQGRGGEAPVVLLNGRRISGMREIRTLPTEAIMRVDILPEEVALKYGYRADQKVVNVVLRRRFNAMTVEARGGTSTEGGGESGKASSSLIRIRNGERLNVDVSYERSASLLESERDIQARSPRRPYAFDGNVTGASGGEIDPALSALAGRPVSVAGIPAGGAPYALADFAAGANAPNRTDISPYRTLQPSSDTLAINAVLARNIGDVSATFNASLEATGSTGLRGLPGTSLAVPSASPFSPFGEEVLVHRYAEDDPLRQRATSETGHLGFSLNGTVRSWQWTVTGNYDRSSSRTNSVTGIDGAGLQARIDAGDPAVDPFGPLSAAMIGPLTRNTARSRSDAGDLQLVASGSPFRLPAGAASATIKIGGTASQFDTRSVRSGIERSADLDRQTGNAQANVDLPIASRRNDVLGAIGDLSANANIAAERISGFGTLTSWGYGLTWKPRDRISLIWSMTEEEGAPTVQQLGNPEILTEGVRLFDYVRGETVDVTRVDGGNPGLMADDRRVMKIGLTVKPFAKTDVSLVANYVSSRIRNGIASLPSPTAAIEEAFPDRFIRDADGALLRVDNRPVNLARQDRRQLRWGVNFSKPLKSYQPSRGPRSGGPGQAAAGSEPPRRPEGGLPENAGQDRRADAASQPGREDVGNGRSGVFSGRGPGFGRDRGQGGRLQLSVYHTWMFQDEILIRDGLPALDLLNGDASGSGGGSPRHRIEAQAGLSKNGWGVRLSGDWQSGTTVNGGAAGNSSALRFSDLTTANVRLFANLGSMPMFAGQSWARGARVTVSVDNIFNERLKVRDQTGATPLSYQPGYLDPLGRVVRVSFRKLLF